MKPLLFLPTLIVLLYTGCQPATESSESAGDLGTLQYNFSISEASKADFDNGLLLLHSFEYEDAQDAFKLAIAADSTEVMAYWGVTMTHYKALWGLQDVPKGREIMNLLGATEEERVSKAEEGVERDFWKGVEILFGEGELTERNQAYADHMGTLYDRYKGDQEVAAFYALSLMWSVPTGRDTDIFGRSATVAAGILKENPNHPGALHYTIHAYDDPEFASQAIFAANKYAKVAPDAVHALHMPSHIYLARGMWDEMVASNEVSYEASVSRMERKGLSDAARGYHSYFWLHYGYLQQGQFDKATALMKDMLIFTPSADSRGANAYLVGMQNSQLVETGEWKLEDKPLQMVYDKLSLDAKAKENFFRSMMAFQTKEGTIIKEQIEMLDGEIASAEGLVTTEGIAMCSAGPTRYAPDKNSIYRAKTISNQMSALLALTEGDEMKAEDYFKKAVDFENQSSYSFGPPDIPYPSFEQYGEWLLTKERYQEALDQFENSLSRAPLRAKALKGKIAALNGLGKTDEAQKVQEELDTYWKKSQIASL
jgi:tetratricopeptide (TPR) repeat protein